MNTDCHRGHAKAAGRGACRLLPRAGRPAVPAASPGAPLRRCPDAGPSPHSRRRADHVAAAAAALDVGGASVVGRRRRFPFCSTPKYRRGFSSRCRSSRWRSSSSTCACGGCRGAVSRARPDCRRRTGPASTRPLASAMRLRNSLAAELLLIVLIYGVGIPTAGLHRRRREHLGRGTGGEAVRIRQSVARRLVARAGQRADLPVPARPLVFPHVHLDPLSLAGVTHRTQARPDPSRPRRRAGIPRAMSSTRSLRCSSRTGSCSRA